MLCAKIKRFDAGTRQTLCKAVKTLHHPLLRLRSPVPVGAVLAVCLILP